MFGSRLLFAAGLFSIAGCGSAKAVASGSVGAEAKVEEPAEAAGTASTTTPERKSKHPSAVQSGGSAENLASVPEPPGHDPELLREAVDRTASTPDGRERLGLRLAVVEQGPDAPWLIAVANRGDQPLRVLFDLRTLSLEVVPPVPPQDPTAKPKRVQKPPKPTQCALPKDVVPTREEADLEIALSPGEAIVDVFDPRLYCLPSDGVSPLVPGATVHARLGFPEKTKTVWQRGKAEKKLVEQAPPFVAHVGERTEPEKVAPPPLSDAPGGEPELAFERVAVKNLVAQPLTLGDAYAPKPPVESDDPIALVLGKGSDARTERDATVTVSILNRSPKPQTVYFRRELVSFEVSGPTGLVECNAGPDLRAPERLSFSTLQPGKRLSATSRLIELCPMGALRVPGLYLVHGRFDTSEAGEAFGLRAFRGRVTSDKPALVRVRKGWGDLAPRRKPQRLALDGVARAPEGTAGP